MLFERFRGPQNEPLAQADITAAEARQRVIKAKRISNFIRAGALSLAVFFSGVVAWESGNTNSSTGEPNAAQVDGYRTVPENTLLADLAFVDVAFVIGLAYGNRRYLRKSVNSTVERYKKSLMIPDGGPYSLKLIEDKDGKSYLQVYLEDRGIRAYNGDAIETLPGLLGFMGGALYEAAHIGAVAPGLETTLAHSGLTLIAAGAGAMALSAFDARGITDGAIERINQLDPLLNNPDL